MSLQPKDVLTRDDVLKLVEGCKNIRDKALVYLLYDSGARANEILKLTVGDVTIEEACGFVTLKGSGGARQIPFVESLPFVTSLLNNHHFRNEPDAPLWLTDPFSKRGMSYPMLSKLLKTLKERCGLKKPLSPHKLRHARLTHLAEKNWGDQRLKVFAGWTPGSRMAERYIHLTGRDLKNAMLETYGVESIKPKAVVLKSKKCQRCDILNEPTNQYCKRCGLILDETLALKRMNKQTEVKKLEEEMKAMIEAHVQEALGVKDKQVRDLQSFVENTLKNQEEKQIQITKELQQLETLFEKILKQRSPKEVLKRLEQLNKQVLENLDHTKEFMDATEKRIDELASEEKKD